MRLTNKKTGKDTDKPAAYFEGGEEVKGKIKLSSIRGGLLEREFTLK